MKKKFKLNKLVFGILGAISLTSVIAVVPTVLQNNSINTVLNESNVVRASTNSRTSKVQQNSFNWVDTSKITRQYADDVEMNKEIRFYSPDLDISSPNNPNYVPAFNNTSSTSGVVNKYNLKLFSDNQGWRVDFGKVYSTGKNGVPVSVRGGTKVHSKELYGFSYADAGFSANKNNSFDLGDSTYLRLYEEQSNSLFPGSTSVYYNALKLGAVKEKVLNGVVKLKSTTYKDPLNVSGLPSAMPIYTGDPFDYISIYDRQPGSKDTNYSIQQIMTKNTSKNWLQANTNFDPNNINANAVANVDGKSLQLETGYVNIGLYDGKIYFGRNPSTMAINVKNGGNLDSLGSILANVTPQDFVTQFDQIQFENMFSLSCINTPNLVLDGGVTVEAINNFDAKSVQIKVSTKRSFKPNLNTQGANFDLVDNKWIKEEPMFATFELPYRLFSQDQSASQLKASIDLTQLKNKIAGVEAGITYAIDMPTYEQALKDNINNFPGQYIVNFPMIGEEAKNNQYVDPNVPLKIVPSTDGNSVDVTLGYLSQNTTTSAKPTYVTGTFKIIGFNQTQTTIEKEYQIVDGFNKTSPSQIKVDPNLLQTYLRTNEEVLRAIAKNYPEAFITSSKNGLLVNKITEVSDKDGTLVANITFKDARLSTGFGELTENIKFSGFTQSLPPEQQTTLIENVDITSIADANLGISNKTFSIDLKEDEKVKAALLSYMNMPANFSKFVKNAPTEQQLNGTKMFSNIKFDLSKENAADLEVNVTYQAKQLNGTLLPSKGSFYLTGLNNNPTAINNTYIQELGGSLNVPKLKDYDAETLYDYGVDKQNALKAIANAIKEQLSKLLVNAPANIEKENQDFDYDRIYVETVDNPTGTAEVYFNLKGAFSIDPTTKKGTYKEVKFKISVSGFKPAPSRSDGLTVNPAGINFKNLVNNIKDDPKLADQYAKLSPLFSDYALDAYDKFEKDATMYTALRDVINASPELIYGKIVDLKNYPIIKPSENGKENFEILSPAQVAAEEQVTDKAILVVRAQVLTYPDNPHEGKAYTQQDIKLIGFNKTATEYNKESFIPPKDLGNILGLKNIYNSSAQLVAEAINNENYILPDGNTIKDRIVGVLNKEENINRIFTVNGKKIGINNYLQGVINGLSIADKEGSNLVFSARSEDNGNGSILDITINGLPLSQKDGSINMNGSITSSIRFNYTTPNLVEKPLEGIEIPQGIPDSITGQWGDGQTQQQNASKSNNDWIWILLGVLGGVALLSLIIFIIFKIYRNGGSSKYSDDYYDYF